MSAEARKHWRPEYNWYTLLQTVASAYSWTPFGKRQDEVGAKCTALGKGEVNLKGCLDVLKQHGYSAVLSLETEGEFSADEGRKLIEESRAWLLKTLAR